MKKDINSAEVIELGDFEFSACWVRGFSSILDKEKIDKKIWKIDSCGNCIIKISKHLSDDSVAVLGENENNSNNLIKKEQYEFRYSKIDNLKFSSLKKLLYLFSKQNYKNNFAYDGDQYAFELRIDGNVVKSFNGILDMSFLKEIKKLLDGIYINSNIVNEPIKSQF